MRRPSHFVHEDFGTSDSIIFAADNYQADESFDMPDSPVITSHSTEIVDRSYRSEVDFPLPSSSETGSEPLVTELIRSIANQLKPGV